MVLLTISTTWALRCDSGRDVDVDRDVRELRQLPSGPRAPSVAKRDHGFGSSLADDRLRWPHDDAALAEAREDRQESGQHPRQECSADALHGLARLLE